MSKKYDIDIDFLMFVRNIIYECKTMQREVDLFLINRLISILNNSEMEASSKRQVEQQLVNDLDDMSFYQPYYPYVRNFRGRGESKDIPYTPNYNKIHISDDYTVSLVSTFMKEMKVKDDDINDFLEDAEGHLKFIKANSNIEGETTFIRTTGEFFCLSPNYNSIMKPTVLAHEMTHILDWYINPDFIKYYLINEFNSLFREMVACDYFAKELNLGDDNIKRRYAIHSIIKRCADDVFYRTQILHLFARDNIVGSMGKIYSMFGTDYLTYLTQDSLADNYIYQIAYLIAIELYILYQSDKDKALWIADKLVMQGNNDNVLEILKNSGIVLNEHSLDYENDLILKLKINK